LIPWLALGLIAFMVLLKVSAPYGKFTNTSWGPNVSFRWGWIIQEIVSPICFSIFFLIGDTKLQPATCIFFIIWILHYFNRSILFPLRQKQTATCPLVIVLSAIFFNIINGFTNGYFLGHLANYPSDYIYSNNFIFGMIVLIMGVIINIKSDNILIKIKKKNQGYEVPKGFLYRYVSCPNYLGEIIEWIGFSIMTLSFPALIFAIWTACNLVPRAISNHKWYTSKFSNYPKDRKIIIPFIF
tara:strand:- start:405 stop:1127 length:723 start_codon:yes stop_codon:yes gene_type:complete